MDALIVGFGSIGKRHLEVLKGIDAIKNVHLVTKQDIAGETCFRSLAEVADLSNYGYYIICSETVKHYEQLCYICSKVCNKKILVEKPLFDKKYNSITLNNDVYTAYNLRFHPLLNKLKLLLEGQDVYYANVLCGQYLPTWRPGRKYQESYSASIALGGGVLRDLSHELDYMGWLFGDLEIFKSINTKRSDLEIQSDDIFTAIGVTSAKTIFNITIDYMSKRAIRRLVVHTNDFTIELDMINNGMLVSSEDSESKVVKIGAVDRNYTYLKMHEALITGEVEQVCTFEEGLRVVNLINSVSFEECND